MRHLVLLCIGVFAAALSVWSGANIVVAIGCTYLSMATGVLLAKGEKK